jgi:hypothetical protein
MQTSGTVFGQSEAERLLAALFVERYGIESAKKLEEFMSHLARIVLPLDLTEQLRKRVFPGYPGYEDGLPAVYYYFVPGSGWGDDNPAPADPLELGFVRSADGFGLNIGCPLRLARAFQLLASLDVDDQVECREGLASATKHLATVEELLWLDVWQRPYNVRRPTERDRRHHDWNIVFSDLILHVECKFRPSDWPRLVDGVIHLPPAGAITSKATRQLPNRGGTGALNVVAVTGMARLSPEFRTFCANELLAAENVDAIIYRTFACETTVLSLNQAVANQVHSRIAPLASDEFQPFYFVTFNRPQQHRRKVARTKRRPSPVHSAADLIEVPVQSLEPRKFFVEPPLPYRYELDGRLKTGEPKFRYIPPYLEK